LDGDLALPQGEGRREGGDGTSRDRLSDSPDRRPGRRAHPAPGMTVKRESGSTTITASLARPPTEARRDGTGSRRRYSTGPSRHCVRPHQRVATRADRPAETSGEDLMNVHLTVWTRHRLPPRCYCARGTTTEIRALIDEALSRRPPLRRHLRRVPSRAIGIFFCGLGGGLELQRRGWGGPEHRFEVFAVIEDQIPVTVKARWSRQRVPNGPAPGRGSEAVGTGQARARYEGSGSGPSCP